MERGISMSKKIYIKRISALLIFCLIFSLCSCGKKQEEPTTERVESDELGLTDADGFVTVKDYVATVQDNVRIRREASEDAGVYITLDKGVDLSRMTGQECSLMEAASMYSPSMLRKRRLTGLLKQRWTELHMLYI